MRRVPCRAISALACGLAALSAWSSASATPALTPQNSVLAPLLLRSSLTIKGVGCGAPATGTVTMPSGALEVRVRAPAPGDSVGDARVTDIAPRGTAVGVTAVDGSEKTCDPAVDPVPPASRPWSAEFDLEVAFKRREMVAVVADWRLRVGYVVRPPMVALRAYTPDATDTVRKVRWTRYGGRKAIGFGIFKAAPFFCPSPARCIPGNGQRVRVELTRPSYCPNDNVLRAVGPVKPVAFYGRVSVFNTHQIGVLKPGTNFEGYDPYKHACQGLGIPIP